MAIQIYGAKFVEKDTVILLTCNATGHEYVPEQLDWFFNGNKIISDDPPGRISIKTNNSIQMKSISSVLRIKGVQMEDSGLYLCRTTSLQIESFRVVVISGFSAFTSETLSHAPYWARDLSKLLNPKSEHDWRLLSSRLGYNNADIRGWVQQADPCMALLNEWYITHKTSEATLAVLTQLQEMDRLDAAVIVENAMKNAANSGITKLRVKLLKQHLEVNMHMNAGWTMVKWEVNLAVSLNKPIIPLLVEQCSWPPPGSMGPIFSEYLFIRFFQRSGEDMPDQRYWAKDKFQELLMQLNVIGLAPEEGKVGPEYKNWWVPVVQEIEIDKSKTKNGGTVTSEVQSNLDKIASEAPDIFISYQWAKQKSIIRLYERLTSLGFSCWLDIKQMGGGDSLYDKIDKGIRGCKVVLSCVTHKYSLSANCRREVSLTDALKKPMIPLLLEEMTWPPSGPMSMIMTQLLYINFSKNILNSSSATQKPQLKISNTTKPSLVTIKPQPKSNPVLLTTSPITFPPSTASTHSQ
ncbi:hypothetical protein Btru_051973, partial [Bulinus truncatus]